LLDIYLFAERFHIPEILKVFEMINFYCSQIWKKFRKKNQIVKQKIIKV